MARLSVNINKVALIRNARGGNMPDLVQFALDCEAFGAQGITVHPREDQRHIRYDDIPKLKTVVKTEFNVEGYPSPQFMNLMEANRPHQCTLVPDPPGVLTSSCGWNFARESGFLTDILGKLKEWNIRSSLFVEPNGEDCLQAKKIGADRIEFYTGHYAVGYEVNKEDAVASYFEAARVCNKIGLGINAGHDLNLDNLSFFVSKVPGLLEVSIGHALICDALYVGIKNAILMYLAKIQQGRNNSNF